MNREAPTNCSLCTFLQISDWIFCNTFVILVIWKKIVFFVLGCFLSLFISPASSTPLSSRRCMCTWLSCCSRSMKCKVGRDLPPKLVRNIIVSECILDLAQNKQLLELKHLGSAYNPLRLYFLLSTRLSPIVVLVGKIDNFILQLLNMG